ncbi:MAG: RusA family crossover junction endodeoxyribonuclease [Verrucomicrobiota bacterium JB022]|nr:RusA family crossover junction endodeoxyribonuclease [Verrucomicrobiota bacterium JB022]
MSRITFEVLGEPKGQPRQKYFAVRTARGTQARAVTPPTANDWKTAVKVAVRPHLPAIPILGPVRLTAVYRFARPKVHYNKSGLSKKGRESYWHTGKPDRDNIEKATLDALSDAGLWHDDAQVCDGSISKRYANPGELPGATIVVEPLPLENGG